MGLLARFKADDTLYWLRKMGVLLVFALSPLAFPAVTMTPRLLLEVYKKLLPDRAAISKDWRTARTGEVGLPQEVRTMIAMLRDNHVMEFRYSEAIVPQSDDNLTQRLAEGAYPIRINVEAHHVLASASETLAQGCLVLASREGIVLAHCP